MKRKIKVKDVGEVAAFAGWGHCWSGAGAEVKSGVEILTRTCERI